MKRIVVLSIVLILLLINKALSSNKEKDSLISLELKGNISFHGKKQDGVYKVHLICGNKVIDSLEIKDKRSFKFQLRKNEYYGIRISKKGFVPKLVSVCTDIKDEHHHKYSYHFCFDTKLFGEEKLSKMDKDMIDFPIAVIKFNDKKETFNYNKKYTNEIKRKTFSKEKNTAIARS